MKKFFKFLGIAVLLFIIYIGITTYPKLDIVSGFSAKSVASGHFIDGRSLEIIEKGDNDIDNVRLATNEINEKEKVVYSSAFGLKERKAIYREGLGATLINDDFDETKPYLIPKRTKIETNLPFPYGNLEPKDSLLPEVNYEKLNLAVANAFDQKGEKIKRTRALLVIYKDKIIAEKYEEGFSKNTKFLGWSMTKSITATYFGVLQYQGKIDINKPTPLTEWANDSRSKITLHNLIQMNSGLEWNEDYGNISDVTKMLFLADDMAKVQLEKPAAFEPNKHWNYSSGTTNLLSGILRRQFQNHQDYLDFWYSSLIDKIGMHSMLIEPDMAGNFVGSSYGWATARDWAKFGLLYLHEGNWNGEQIFDKSWAKYVATPTPTSKGEYGGHFWLNAGGKYPDVPKDMYFCGGFQGQKVIIIPSKELVIVRFGLTEDEDFDFNGMMREIITSIK
ncbi:MAG TPA: serine hydrolase [Flavobacterium sp.]|nr:serine hydrolase [Flavobacterium sp.]